MKEARNTHEMVKIEGTTPSAFRIGLDFMYGLAIEFEPSTIMDVLDAASKWQVFNDLVASTRLCATYLKCGHIHRNEHTHTHTLTHTHIHTPNMENSKSVMSSFA